MWSGDPSVPLSRGVPVPCCLSLSVSPSVVGSLHPVHINACVNSPFILSSPQLTLLNMPSLSCWEPPIYQLIQLTNNTVRSRHTWICSVNPVRRSPAHNPCHMLQALHLGSRQKQKSLRRPMQCWGQQVHHDLVWKPKSQSKEGESLEVCTTSLMVDETIEMPNYGAPGTQRHEALGGNTTALSWGETGSPNVDTGKEEVHWQLRTMTFLGGT